MDWQKIVIHHTASPIEVCRSGKTVPVNATMIREWHKTKGVNNGNCAMKAGRILGFRNAFSLEEGIKKTVLWY